MSFHIQASDYPHFEQVLQARAKTLRAEIRASLQRADQEHYAKLAGQVHDTGDESLADLLVDVNQAEIARDVQELRDIERAQQRLRDGSFGVCTNCGEWIARARLDASPAAQRCIKCQQAAEQSGSSPPPASL